MSNQQGGLGWPKDPIKMSQEEITIASNLEEKVDAMIEKAGEVWRCIECGRVGGDAMELVEKIGDGGEDWICIECGRVAKDPSGLTLKVEQKLIFS